MQHPLWLQHQLGHHWRPVGPKLVQHFLGVIQSPGSVIGDIGVVLGPIVDPPLPAGDRIGILVPNQVCLSRLYSFEVALVLLLVDVVGILVDAEG